MGLPLRLTYVTRSPKQPVQFPGADGGGRGSGLLGAPLSGSVLLLCQHVSAPSGVIWQMSPATPVASNELGRMIASVLDGQGECVCLHPALSLTDDPLLASVVKCCRNAAIPLQVFDYRQAEVSHAYLAPSTGRVFLRKRPAQATVSKQRTKVSSRVANPLAHDESPHATFCDTRQAKATTATALFRNPPLFDGLRDVIIPAYLALDTRIPLSIWSAGCSSGEETYSLAMTVEDERARLKESFHYKVFGTDINPDRLADCRNGEYRYSPPSSFQDKRAGACLQAYGTVSNGRWRVGPEIRRTTDFFRFDLRNKPSSKHFNYIVCNHVLQYYAPEAQEAIIRNFCSVLRAGGGMYLEGITPALVDKMRLTPLGGIRNLYAC